jgi:HPr kinase/phosphorylase
VENKPLSRKLSIQDLYHIHAPTLKLEWVSGQEFAENMLHPTPEDVSCMVGYLNFVHPPQITLLGEQEFNYLANLEVDAYHEAIKQFFRSAPSLIILCEGQTPTDEITQAAHDLHVSIMVSPLSASTVLSRMSHQLSEMLAPSITVHGVFLEVFDLGVLLTGAAGVGKSELALELINRGHRLIADDSPLFSKYSPDALTGRAPALLKDFLEVRGLGIVNVRAMFGHTAVKDMKKLSLIVHIVDMSDPIIAGIDRLQGMHREREFLGIHVPEVTVPAGPGRSLSVLVEAAVHNQLLRNSGYNASEIFAENQMIALRKSS